MATIHLESKDVPSHLRGAYCGKRFSASVAESVMIPADAGLWSGGTRDCFRVVRLADGAEIAPTNENAFYDGRREKRVLLQPGFCVARHTQGMRGSLHFFVHASDAAKLIPAPPVALTALQSSVLGIINGVVSAARLDVAQRNGVSAAQFQAAKAELIALGLLNKSGAITTAGKNAAPRAVNY